MNRAPFASLEARGLGHAYGEARVLEGVNFTLAPGRSYAILGPNGSGKSTLFNILTTAMFPRAGTVLWNGRPLGADLTAARDAMGVVFQAPSLDKKLTVRENLRYQGALFGLPAGVLRERVDAALERFALRDRASHFVETLSGGLARRVEIAKSLLHEPDVLLLDEPSSSLDPLARQELRAVYRSLVAQGKTVILTTHLLDEAEDCDENLILHRGKLVAQGKPEELKRAIDRKIVFIKSKAPDALASELAAAYGVQPRVEDARLRVEVARDSDFLRAVIQSHGAGIEELTYRSPTLEDVFMHFAGTAFDRGWAA